MATPTTATPGCWTGTPIPGMQPCVRPAGVNWQGFLTGQAGVGLAVAAGAAVFWFMFLRKRR